MKQYVLAAATALGAVLPLSASEFIFEDFRVTLSDSSSQPWVGTFDGSVQLGAFSLGFTPTLSNVDQWLANWSSFGTAGYYDSSGPEWSAQLQLNDNSVFEVGRQLSLWVFDLQLGGSEWALFTDPSWSITPSSPLDVTPHFLAFTEETVAQFGSLDFELGAAATASTGPLTPVPEPSTYGLFAGIGILSLALYRRAKPRTR